MNRGWHSGLVVVCGILVLGLAGTAYAHLALESSEPAKGDLLTVAPRELRLTFTEEVERAVARILLLGPEGGQVALSPLRTPADSPMVLVAAIRAPLTAGIHTVEWRVAGADGHPVRGTFSFEIWEGAAGLPTESGLVPGGAEPAAGVTTPGQGPLPIGHRDPTALPDAGRFDAESPAYVAIRWLQYTGIIIAIGALAFHLLVLRLMHRTAPDALSPPQMRIRAATVGLWAALLAALSAAARLYAQSLAMYGSAEALSGESIAALLLRTVWGWAWVLQIAAVFIAVAGFHLARRARAVGWAVALPGTLLLAVTPALSGHAASAPRLAEFAVFVDTMHVIGAGGWLGSLAVVLVAGIPAALRLPQSDRAISVAHLVNAYSPTALIFAGLMVASGLFATWLHAGIGSALWESDYGRTILIKFGVFSMVAAIGLYNWRRVRPALGGLDGARRIRRSATAELVVGALVLIVTAVLVATPPPTHAPEASTLADQLPVSSE